MDASAVVKTRSSMCVNASFSCRCLHCDMVFKSIQGQKSHIEEKHCEVLHKCSVCAVAFKTADGCEAHLKNKHDASKTCPQ